MPEYFNINEPGILDWLITTTEDHDRRVIQTPIDGSEPTEWQSAAAANRAVRVSKGGISRAIRLGSITAGSIWTLKSANIQPNRKPIK